MAGVVIDTSVWIDFFAAGSNAVEEALQLGVGVMPPIVVSELVSGARTPAQRLAIGEILQDVPVHETSLEHWIRVGDLRRELARGSLKVTVPDAHVAQCALDRNAILLSRDAIFVRIAERTKLRLRRE